MHVSVLCVGTHRVLGWHDIENNGYAWEGLGPEQQPGVPGCAEEAGGAA